MVAPLDFTDLEKKYHVPTIDPHEGAIVVDGLPVVPSAKVGKLESVVRKIFGGDDIQELLLCCDEDGTTKGYAFLRFSTVDLATVAVKNGNNYKLDKTHTLLVNFLKDIYDMQHVETEYIEPEFEPFVEKEFLKQWLLDPRDQFAVMKQDILSIYSNNQSEEPSLMHERNNWSEMYMSFSPKGSYLATFHKQGIAIWAGENWSKISRLSHPNVKLIDWSPNEKYLTTWSFEGFQVDEAIHVR